MKKDGIWIDEEGSGRIIDTFTLPCLLPPPRFGPGDLAVRIGTTDVYQVIDAALPGRGKIFYLAQKVRIRELRTGGLAACEVGPVTRLSDRELQPLPGALLLEPTDGRPCIDLVGESQQPRALPGSATARPSLPHRPTGLLPRPTKLIEGDHS